MVGRRGAEMAWAGGRYDALYAQSAALMETSPAGSQESFARRPCEARAAAGVEGKAALLSTWWRHPSLTSDSLHASTRLYHLHNIGSQADSLKPGFNLGHYAETCHKVMQALGYNEYGR